MLMKRNLGKREQKGATGGSGINDLRLPSSEMKERESAAASLRDVADRAGQTSQSIDQADHQCQGLTGPVQCIEQFLL